MRCSARVITSIRRYALLGQGVLLHQGLTSPHTARSWALLISKRAMTFVIKDTEYFALINHRPIVARMLSRGEGQMQSH